MPRYPFQQPVVTYGTAAGRANYGDTSQRGYSRRGRPQVVGTEYPNEDVNVQMARILAQDAEPGSQKLSDLQKMIYAGSPEERKKQDKIAMFQWQQMVKAGANPNNPLSEGEMKESYRNFQINHAASNLPMPMQYYKKAEEEEDPKKAMLAIQNSLAKKYGKEPTEYDGTIGYGKDGRPDPRDVQWVHAQEQKNASNAGNSAYMGWLKTETTRIRNSKKDLMKNPALFNQESAAGEMLERPTKGYWTQPEVFEKQEDVLAYDRAKAAWDELTEQEVDRAKKMADAGSGYGNTPAEYADAPTELVPRPGKVDPQTEQAVGPVAFYPESRPFVFKDAQHFADKIETIQAEANRSGVTQWVINPDDGQPYPVQPR